MHRIPGDNSQLATVQDRGLIVKLPIEIQERTIGFVDRQCAATIANCARVCHAWLPFSRYKLYDEIVLRHRGQWDSFVCLLLCPSPEIIRYFQDVRMLYIHPIHALNFDDSETKRRIGWKAEQERPWAYLVLLHGARRLSNLMHIQFRSIDWSQRWFGPGLLYAGHAYRFLTQLELWDCTFSSIRQLQQLVFGFRALSNLTLTRISFKHSSRPLIGSPTVRKGPQLTRLFMNCTSDIMIEVSQWLIGTRSVHNLSWLNWAPFRPSERTNESLHDLVHAVDGSLEYLKCWLSRSAQGSFLFWNISVLSIANLSNLM